MNISFFLAQAFGLYFLIIGFGLVINGNRIRPLLNEMMDNPAMLLVSGFIALILGILLVLTHNIWVMDWRVIITIAGWMALIKGGMLIVFPQAMINFSKKWVGCNFTYYATMSFVFLIGIFLTYHGFF